MKDKLLLMQNLLPYLDEDEDALIISLIEQRLTKYSKSKNFEYTDKEYNRAKTSLKSTVKEYLNTITSRNERYNKLYSIIKTDDDCESCDYAHKELVKKEKRVYNSSFFGRMEYYSIPDYIYHKIEDLTGIYWDECAIKPHDKDKEVETLLFKSANDVCKSCIKRCNVIQNEIEKIKDNNADAAYKTLEANKEAVECRVMINKIRKTIKNKQNETSKH